MGNTASAIPCRLIVESGDHSGMIFPLREPVISIGRAPDNTIQIIDTRMSRNHTAVLQNEGRWFARDLGSKNGTQLNERPLASDTQLNHGDRLQVGDTIFTFETEGHAVAGEGSIGVQVVSDTGILAQETFEVGRAMGTESQLGLTSRLAPGDSERLSVLYKVTEIIGSVLEQDVLLEKLLDLIQEFLEPDRSSVLLYDEKTGVLVPRVIRRPEHAQDDIVISNTIIEQAVRDKVAVLVSDAASDNRYSSQASIVIQRIHSAICAPLIVREEVVGVLYVDRRRSNSNYEAFDLMVIAGIANQAALAISNARLHRRLLRKHAQERELEIARTIQRRLLPEETPQLPGYDLCAMSEPARQVGGDYFDFIALPDGRLVLAIADVSGKGVPAAILLASVRAAVQVEARALEREPLVEIVSRLNQMVCRDTSSAMFVTMVLAVLEPRTRRLEYCNMGHVYPTLLKADGTLSTLETGGVLLGVLPGAPYQVGELTLDPGSTLFFFTDGVSDVMNPDGEMYGIDRLTDYTRTLGEWPAETMMARIVEETAQYAAGAEAFDDFTMMILKSLAS